jgi:hypothetical protein|tara:strand:+ start:2604 stop:2840 length:237 start_codon:yes stop_codon:yes gene_type:complete
MKKILLGAVLMATLLTGCVHARFAPASGHCPAAFPIKGNADSSLYHLPESPFYYRTQAELCFAKEESARKMGYVSAKR